MDLRTFPVLVFIPALLLAQSPTSVRAVPEDVLFHFFFLRITASDSAAKAQGRSDSPATRAVKIQARLTDAEISLLKEVALSCNEAYTAKTRSGGAEVRQLAALNPQRAAPPAAVRDRIETLERERTKVITDCQDSLKRGLGTTGYAKLQTYVLQSEGSRVRYVDPATATPTPLGGLK